MFSYQVYRSVCVSIHVQRVALLCLLFVYFLFVPLFILGLLFCLLFSLLSCLLVCLLLWLLFYSLSVYHHCNYYVATDLMNLFCLLFMFMLESSYSCLLLCLLFCCSSHVQFKNWLYLYNVLLCLFFLLLFYSCLVCRHIILLVVISS